MTASRNKPIALILATVVCALCLCAILPAAILMPSAVSTYLTAHEPALMEHITLIVAVYYVAMAVAAAVLILLLGLLRVVSKGNVFTPVSGRLVYTIAALVLVEGGVFAVLGAVYPPALAITVVALAMGLCFLVVGFVLREAAIIKAENDGTI